MLNSRASIALPVFDDDRPNNALRFNTKLISALIGVIFVALFGYSRVAPASQGWLQSVPTLDCSKTLLLDWGSFNYGIASVEITLMQAIMWAESAGYNVLFSREPNVYGEYLDYYEPAESQCTFEEGYYWPQCITQGTCPEPQAAFDFEKKVWKSKPARLHFNNNAHKWLLNDLTVDTYLTPSFAQLPHLDSSKPFPSSATLPKSIVPLYARMLEINQRHFRLNKHVQDRVDQLRQKLSLDGEQSERAQLTIGVHYRGGDKLIEECTPSSRMSCGNVTLHLEAAAQAADQMASRSQSKPRLLLMSAEPNAKAAFEQDPLSQRFTVETMPDESVNNASYSQEAFNNSPMEYRVESTRNMLAEVEVLSKYSDAFIITSNSNLGRLAMLRGGEDRFRNGVAVRPLDFYWHGFMYNPFYPDCNGKIRRIFVAMRRSETTSKQFTIILIDCTMCRLLVVKSRTPQKLCDFTTRPEHSIIKQASDCRLRLDAGSVNADGFGIGWYETDRDATLGLSGRPMSRAWSNRNLARLADKISSPLIFAHVRAATGASLSEENCHPFTYGALLWMHNGHIANFKQIKRKLQFSLSDEIFDFPQGQTDSEWAFALFLQILSTKASLQSPSFPFDTLKQAMLEVLAQLNTWAAEAGTTEPSLLNFAVTDGYSVVCSRYISSATDEAASLYFSTGSSFEETETPGEYRMRKFDKRESVMLIASEPLTFDRADWLEIPCQTLVVITPRMNLLQIPIIDQFYQHGVTSDRSKAYVNSKGLHFSK